jgi:SAM-dependent methyltransferase
MASAPSFGLIAGPPVTDTRAFQHPAFARVYMPLADVLERVGAAAHRDQMLAGLTGDVLEIGPGHGLTFSHYPPTVTAVLAVEPEDTLRRHARKAAVAAPVPIDVVAGHANDLPAADHSVDAVVVSLVLCSLPSLTKATAEIVRVLKHDGELRFYEHVRSRRSLVGLIQDVITPLWSRAAGAATRT